MGFISFGGYIFVKPPQAHASLRHGSCPPPIPPIKLILLVYTDNLSMFQHKFKKHKLYLLPDYFVPAWDKQSLIPARGLPQSDRRS